MIGDIISSMMTHQEKLTIWSNAYTAALTGILSKKINDRDRYTANNVSAITDQCKAFADRTLNYTDHVTLFCLHAQSLELTLKHWNRLLDTMPIETFWERARYPNSWYNYF